jgi:hypothetical protein
MPDVAAVLALLDTFDWEGWADALDGELRPLTRDLAVGAGERVTPQFDFDDPFVQAWFTGYVGERIVQLEGTTREAVVDLIRRQLAAGTASSPTVLAQEIAAAVREQFEGYETWRALRIARTEVGTVANTATALGTKQAGFTHVDVFDGDSDGPCASANGAVWTVEEALASPLGHPNCLVGDSLVWAPDRTAAFARWFDGEVVVLRTAANQLLACTPNHPVLTRRGFVAAHLLRQGDHVFQCLNRERVWPLNPHHDHAPSAIEEVAGPSRVSRGVTSRAMPASAEYFHGDARNGDVYVEWTFRGLKDTRDAALGQPAGERAFRRTDVRLRQVLADRAALQVFIRALHAAYRGVRGGSDLLALLRRHLRVKHALRFARTARHADALQQSSHVLGAHVELAPDVRRRETFVDVKAAQRRVIRALSRPTAVSSRQTSVVEPSRDRLRVAAESGGDLVDRLAGLVEPVEIRDVGRREFRGHVFNLETQRGWYLAGDLITHNCVRSFSPHVD